MAARMEYLVTLETIPGQLPSGAKKRYWVYEDETVSDIKVRIALATEISSDKQILVYRETPLVDECEKLREIVNKHPVRPAGADVTLTLLFKSIKPAFVKVTMTIVGGSNRKIAVMVESSATVGQLKTKIDMIEGVPPSRQILLARLDAGSDSIAVPLSDDNVRLSDIIFEDSIIYVYTDQLHRRGDKVPITVVVTTSSDLQATFGMEVEVDTVYTLTAEIKKSVIVKSLPEMKTFSLHLIGGQSDHREELIRGDYTLSSYGINTSNCKVHLTPYYRNKV